MRKQTREFALCLDNSGNEASLILGKVYRIVRDARAAKDDLVRIVDEAKTTCLRAASLRS